MRIKDARQTFLGIWIRNLLQGKEIQVFGDGKQRRDYNYVEDVLDALLIAAIENNAVGKVYNLGAPDPLSLEDTAKIMCHKTEGGDYQIIPFPEDRKAIDVGDFICDYLAFRDQFGWEPKVNFEDGILRSIEYFRREIEHYI
jgi:nucleoside-diphosphate-sugar epimerase